MKLSLAFALAVLGLFVLTLSSASAQEPIKYAAGAVPEGTTIEGTIDFDQGPERLLDGKDDTFMVPVGGTAGRQWSLFLRFDEPLTTLGGVRLGSSDPHHNYYPKVIELHVDTNGDGTYDLHVGTLDKLGPAKATEGEYLFNRKPAKAHGLELRTTSQNVAGVHRSFMLNRLELLYTAANWGPADAEEATPAAQAPAAFNQVDMALRTNRPFPAITVGDEDKATIRLTSKSQQTLRLHPRATMTAFEGHKQVWTGDLVELKAGESVDVPFAPGFERRGWWDIALSLVNETQDAQAQRRTTTLAYFAPVGMRRGEAGDDMLVGFTETLYSDATAEAGTLVGVDWSRDGMGWPETEPREGEFEWDRFDAFVERAERFGIIMQAGLGYTPGWAIMPKYLEKLPNTNWPAGTHPPREDAWRAYARALAERYKGRIRYWETWNEADLYGFFKGTTDEYLMMQRVAYEEFKSVDPDFQILTSGFATIRPHGGQNHNPDMQLRTIRDAQQYFDYHAHHEHGHFAGFASAIDGPLAKLREHLKKERPLWLNETSIDVGRGVHYQAESLVKKITFAKARGAAAYNWFHMYRQSHRHDADNWGTLIGEELQPRPHYVAFNEVVRHLRGKANLGQLDLGPGRWGFAFGDTDEQVLVLWREASDSSDLLVEVPLPAGASVERWDMMGNRLAAPANQSGAIVPVVNRPTFVVIRPGGDERVRAIAALDPTASRVEGNPDDIRIRFAGEAQRFQPAFAIQPLIAAEPAGEPVEVRLVADTGELPSLRVTKAMHALTPHADRIALDVTHEGQTLARLIVPILETRSIPVGDPADRRPDFVLDHIDQVVGFFQHDPANEHRVWSGPEDLSARVWLRLTDDKLRLRVVVRDDRIHQPHQGRQIFDGDSIQFTLDHHKQTGYFELGAAPSKDGGVTLHAWSLPAGQDDPTARIDATVQTTDDGLTYDLAIPIASLGLTAADLRDRVRFNLLVNDNDGHGRDGYIRIAPGFGDGLHPDRWPTIRFE